MANAKACEIIVGTVTGNGHSFPVSRGGWAKAFKTARDIASGPGDWMALADLNCPGGRIPMYQCNPDKKSRFGATCTIESHPDIDGYPTSPIAARRRRQGAHQRKNRNQANQEIYVAMDRKNKRQAKRNRK